MIKFLLKGIFRDRNRSLLPVIVVSIGVLITVLLKCFLDGIMGESLVLNANFNSGHVKIMTRAYAKESDQFPNDLAIIGTDTLLQSLKANAPDMDWVQRIRFGGLIDFPDSAGETRAQGPVAGWGIDLFSNGSKESERFNIASSLIDGHMPSKPGEALITYDFAEKFKVRIGDKFTLFGSTMDGSMAFRNFTIAGTVRFGSPAIDRGGVVIDIADAQQTFAMQDAAGEILGYFKDGQYNDEKATQMISSFNAKYRNSTDEYAPTMIGLMDQNGLGEYMTYVDSIESIFLFIFVLAMSIVLWNTGLLGGLRRYSEFGVRMALGEPKRHIYTTLIYEGILIGTLGSLIGTSVGLGISYWVQSVGINIGGMMKSSTMMFPSVMRTLVTPGAFVVGFFPGLLSMVLGNALSGIGIYKRQTAQLFKELEV